MILAIAMLVFSICATAQTNGHIEGRIVDMSGGGVTASIRIVQTDTAKTIARLKTDHSGEFRTQALSAGSYTVFAGATLSPV